MMRWLEIPKSKNRVAEELIRTYSREGELVLDPFGGSVTTVMVAKRLGRDFVPVEVCEEYCQLVGVRLG